LLSIFDICDTQEVEGRCYALAIERVTGLSLDTLDWSTLAYWSVCDSAINPAVDALDINNPDCGFFWYKVSKLEHQFINLRHLQHHLARLADRLRAATNTGVTWVGSRL
jgi:hypothetical protein